MSVNSVNDKVAALRRIKELEEEVKKLSVEIDHRYEWMSRLYREITEFDCRKKYE